MNLEGRKFTEGPWDYELWESCEPASPDVYRVIGPLDSSHEATLCELWSGEHDNEANARLIAAAPDLLKALEALAVMYGHAWDREDGALMMMGSSIPQFEAAHDKACAALKKALGE